MRVPDYEQSFTTQKQTLSKLDALTRASCIHPRVHNAAIVIAESCKAKNDLCELRAFYEAVKSGTPDVPGLEKGVKYMGDPVPVDYWVAPHRLLQQCEEGACAEDCESAAMMVAAFAASVGFTVGLRAWGAPERDGFSHLFAVAKLPKNRPPETESMSLKDVLDDEETWKTVSLDTTVPRAYVGWRPPAGRIMTAWIARKNGE